MPRAISRPAQPLKGTVTVPGDKSISHRALIIGACATGETVIHGLLDADDVLATAEALRLLGARVERAADVWRVRGCGVGGLLEPESILDLRNSGTGVRLLAGTVATHPFTTVFTGDRSLRSRPMGRIIEPLRQTGASFWSRSGGGLPLAVKGAARPMPVLYTLPVASAQVKSAILLAGLNAPGQTIVREPQVSRDHSERILADFGADVTVEELEMGGRQIRLSGPAELAGKGVTVPGDVSSAAFPLVAALLVPGSRVSLCNVGVNPMRTGLLATLAEMNANIAIEPRAAAGSEPVADLTCEWTELKGVAVPAERVPAMIDEVPILAIAAASARGVTRLSGLGELRVKESDRLAAMARGLDACGVRVEEGGDSLIIHGTGKTPDGGAEIRADLDHRIAMAFLVLGMVSREPVAVDDIASIATSFPGFVAMMNGLGAQIEEVEGD